MGQAHCKDSTFWVKSKNEIRRGSANFGVIIGWIRKKCLNLNLNSPFDSKSL